MNREDFEDGDLVNTYLRAVPQPQSAYRHRLRARLQTQHPPRWKTLHQTRWLWSGLGAGVVAVVVALALAVQLGPRSATPVSAKAVLERVVRAARNPVPYSGTSVVSYVLRDPLMPRSMTRDVGTYRIVSRWAVQDRRHYRVDATIERPALEDETQTEVADGGPAIWYRQMLDEAVRLGPKASLSLLEDLQGERVLLWGQTVQHFLASYNTKAGSHARLLGQATILGRTADVVEIWPVIPPGTPGPCTRPSNCGPRKNGYGRARLWIDHAHGVVLRYQEYGLPREPGYIQDYVYKVTSISFNRGPSPSQLAYRPPVRVKGFLSATGVVGPVGVGPGSVLQVPPPLIYMDALSGPGGKQYALAGEGREPDPVTGNPTALRVLFTPTGSTRGPYLYIEEQVRVFGLPAAFKAGTVHVMGRCRLWTGRYPDGLRWLAGARGEVSLLAVTDALTQNGLAHYAFTRTQICRR